jgi:hypothetical protein
MIVDTLVHAGAHKGLHYSVGYSGHGVQMATYTGKQVAKYMNGLEEANPWHLAHKRIPGRFGPPWFLPLARATTVQDPINLSRATPDGPESRDRRGRPQPQRSHCHANA